MKALIITPCWDNADYRTENAVKASGLPWHRRHFHSDLTRVRSALISEGLRAGAERLILLDADVVPTAEALKYLATTEDVQVNQAVMGYYPTRTGDRWSINPSKPAEFFKRPQTELQPVDWGGIGLMAVSAESLRRVSRNLPTVRENSGFEWWPFCLPFIDEPGDTGYYPDDRALCWRLALLGTRLVSRNDLKAGHANGAIVLAGINPTKSEGAGTSRPAPPASAQSNPTARKPSRAPAEKSASKKKRASTSRNPRGKSPPPRPRARKARGRARE